MNSLPPSTSERRTFFARLNAGAASLAALSLGGAAMAQNKPSAGVPWQPARHEKDDWLDKLPGKHRLVFDTTNPDGFGDTLIFASNYLRASLADYGLPSGELAIVVVARHRSTPFGFNDAIWAKYGAVLAARAKVEDPKTKQPPKINIYNTRDFGDLLPNRGNTLDSLGAQGVQLAVCSVATRNYAGGIAQALGGNADAIFNELVANIVGNARMVPAGITTVNHAQERGYSLASVS